MLVAYISLFVRAASIFQASFSFHVLAFFGRGIFDSASLNVFDLERTTTVFHPGSPEKPAAIGLGTHHETLFTYSLDLMLNGSMCLPEVERLYRSILFAEYASG